jgi:hypothetical protein
MTNLSYWLVENPVKLVLFLSFVFMFFITKEDMRAIRHRKHTKEIEKRKKIKNGQINKIN